MQKKTPKKSKKIDSFEEKSISYQKNQQEMERERK